MAKEQEAGQELRSSIDGAPPPYVQESGQLENYSTGIDEYGPLPPAIEVLSNSNPTHLTQPQEPPTAAPLSITLDGQLIYPSTPPSNALYHLSFSLDSTGSTIDLEASIPGSLRANGTRYKPHFSILYSLTYGDISTFSYANRGKMVDPTLQITSKHKAAYPGTGILKYTRHGLGKKAWELSYGGKIVLKCKEGVWFDESGVKAAVEENEVSAKKEKVPQVRGQLPMLIFSEGVEETLRGLLVAAWCAKTWYGTSYERRHKSMSISEGKLRVFGCFR
jgi:hypothetical protein